MQSYSKLQAIATATGLLSDDSSGATLKVCKMLLSPVFVNRIRSLAMFEQSFKKSFYGAKVYIFLNSAYRSKKV
jgi:hypothetical protein